MSDVIIRPLMADDKTDWHELFSGYCHFYKVNFSNQLADTVWDWLMDEKTNFYGLVAVVDKKIVGFAHYRSFPNSLAGDIACFFDDLFVSMDMRSKKIGRNLMMAVKAAAKQNGWTMISWLTADDNYRARPLYDTIAKRTSWITYEMDV